MSLICHNAGFDIPNNGEWIGFDMEKQDWVAPAGKGKIELFCDSFDFYFWRMAWHCGNGSELSIQPNPQQHES